MCKEKEQIIQNKNLWFLSIVCSACLLSGCNTITRDMEKQKPQVADTYKDHAKHKQEKHLLQKEKPKKKAT